MRLRGQEIGRRLASSEAVLARLRSSKGYDESYFSNQWDRQRRLQQSAISQKAIDLRNKLGVLMKLEEELIETRCVKPRVHITQTSHHLKTEYNFCRDTIQKLQLKRVRRRKQSEQQELLNPQNTCSAGTENSGPCIRTWFKRVPRTHWSLRYFSFLHVSWCVSIQGMILSSNL